MSDCDPADRLIDVLDFRSVNVPGRVKIFLHPLLGFKNNLIRYKGVDDDSRDDAYQTGDC